MKKHMSMIGVLGLIAVSTAFLKLSPTKAQEENLIRIAAGETIEIGTDSNAKKPSYSWILTKDRKFHNAQRSRFFQTRLAQVGTYILDVSIQDEAGGSSEYRAFTINVTDGPAGETEYPPAATESTPVKAILKTNVPNENGKAYVPPTGGMVKLNPSLSEGKIASYDLDIDSTVDTNGDGNPVNDKDTEGTLSQKTGSPVYLYVLAKSNSRIVTLSVGNLSMTTPSVTSLEIQHDAVFSAGSIASSAPITSNAGSPIRMEIDGLRVRFKAELDPTLTEGKELLLEWNFGDRTKSLLTSPEHTYSAPGSYPISLSIRNITTGEILWTGNDGVTIQSSATTGGALSSNTSDASESSSSSAPAVTSSTTSSEPKGGTAKKTSSLLSIIYVGFIIFMLIAFAIGMYALIVWIKKKTTSGIQSTLEKMENSIVKKETKEEIIGSAVEPMRLKKAESPPPDSVLDTELSKKDFKTQERANTPPTATSGPVPAWLSKGQNGAKITGKENLPTIPAQNQSTRETTPQPAVPSWLKDSNPKPSVQNNSPKAPVATESTKIVSNAPTATAPGAVPSWLKPATPSAETPKVPTSTPSAFGGNPPSQQSSPKNSADEDVQNGPTPKSVSPTTKTDQSVGSATRVTETRPKVTPAPAPAIDKSPVVAATRNEVTAPTAPALKVDTVKTVASQPVVQIPKEAPTPSVSKPPIVDATNNEVTAQTVPGLKVDAVKTVASQPVIETSKETPASSVRKPPVETATRNEVNAPTVPAIKVDEVKMSTSEPVVPTPKVAPVPAPEVSKPPVETATKNEVSAQMKVQDSTSKATTKESPVNVEKISDTTAPKEEKNSEVDRATNTKSVTPDTDPPIAFIQADSISK